jgi:hypothetical protein
MTIKVKCYKHNITTDLMKCKICETVFCTLCVARITNRNSPTVYETITVCPECGSTDFILLKDVHPKKQ